MASVASPTLAKLTIMTPKRAIDVAVPEDVVVAELLPYILRYAGDDAADAGERHGGWAVRRPSGEYLDPAKTLGAQKVLDGELLHLVPGQTEWPEPEYDDLVETIAAGARRYGRAWDRVATRRCGLLACCLALLACTLTTFLFEPPWRVPGIIMLCAAAVLTAAGVVIARALPDAGAGAVLAGCGLPYAFLGGWLLTAPAHLSVTGFGTPQLLLASVALMVFGIIGYLGVTVASRVFVAAIAIGLLGILGAFAGRSLSPEAAAALALTVGIGLLPGYPLLAIRLGRLPLPGLPQRASELLKDEPLPQAPTIFTAAARAEEVLAGLMLALAVVSAVCSVFLAAAWRTSAVLMLIAVATALLLRARLFPIPWQRVPLLATGGAVVVLLLVMYTARLSDNADRGIFLLFVVLGAALACAAGIAYSKKNPSPYLGRIADILDVVAIIALIPLTGYLTGFFAYVQGVMAGIG